MTREEETIIAAFDPWTLCCAVGAANGSTGSRMGFETWLDISKPNWLPEIKDRLGHVTGLSIIPALRAYVRENQNRFYKEVFDEENRKRGKVSNPVLGPGESISIVVNVPRYPQDISPPDAGAE